MSPLISFLNFIFNPGQRTALALKALERFFEEAYDEIKQNNYLEFDEEGIIFAAQCEAQRRFEELE